MMKDPKFQAEMKRYTSSPAYKTAMSRAAEDIEVTPPDLPLQSYLNLTSRYFISHPITELVKRPSTLKEARSRLCGKNERLNEYRKKSTKFLLLIFPFLFQLFT